MEVLDISDIKKPEYAGVVKDITLDGTEYKTAMYGNFALLPDDVDGILVADVTIPSEIKQVGRISTSGIPKSVDIQGDKAYVTDKSGVISIIGITNPPATPLPNITSPVGSSKMAYLTIDDGPSKNNTPKILDTLKVYGIKATFFVLPRDNVDDIYKRILDEGHVIGNHSYSHDYNYLYNSIDKFRSDVVKARSFIYNKLNSTSTVFRFPGGSMGRNKDMIKERSDLLKDLGYSYFDWDVSTADTDPNLKKYGSEDYIVNLLANNVINQTNAKKKLVILMHDSTDKTYTVKALPKIIEGLQKKGYRFDVLTHY